MAGLDGPPATRQTPFPCGKRRFFSFNDCKKLHGDAKYVYPRHKNVNGKKDFWACGDRWVFAGLAKVLADLPRDDPQRARYVERYQAMAAAISRAENALTCCACCSKWPSRCWRRCRKAG